MNIKDVMKKKWTYEMYRKYLDNESRKCYYQRNKEKFKEWIKAYCEIPKNKTRRKLLKKKSDRILNSKTEVKERKNENQKQRKKNDIGYRIQSNLQSAFYMALKHYSKTGKIKSIKKYGIDMKAIIKHLKPFPKDIENYHIDHIIPLSWFDHNNKEEIKWAWEIENLQWLRKELNWSKNNRFILALTMEEQSGLNVNTSKKIKI